MKTSVQEKSSQPLLFSLAPLPTNAPPKHKTVSIVGLGYVGLPLAILARARGYTVSGVEIDARKRELIRTGSVPDLDLPFQRELQQDQLTTVGNFLLIGKADIIVVCVPTPVDKDHNPDLSPVVRACEEIGKHLRKGQLVILESTVHPGTCDEIVIPTLEKASGLKVRKDFGVAHCPERINPGDRYWPVQRIPRVIGASDPKSLRDASEFYRSILDSLVYEMESLREAEAVKVVENSFRDINIAFVNELAMSFSRLGIDVVNVLEGAATKPFGFMLHYPGAGVGGHCIPVDPYYLIRYAKKNGFSHEFLSLARSINEHMPEFTVSLAEAALREKNLPLEGTPVALLGLSYKANVSDVRESPSFTIKRLLAEKGADIRTFDPYALKHSSAASLKEALQGAKAVIIATAHKEFTALSPRSLVQQGIVAVVDGRNCLEKEQYKRAGIAYRGIGR